MVFKIIRSKYFQQKYGPSFFYPPQVPICNSMWSHSYDHLIWDMRSECTRWKMLITWGCLACTTWDSFSPPKLKDKFSHVTSPIKNEGKAEKVNWISSSLRKDQTQRIYQSVKVEGWCRKEPAIIKWSWKKERFYMKRESCAYYFYLQVNRTLCV